MARTFVKEAIVYVGYPKCGKDTQTEPLERLGEKVLVTGRHLKAMARKNPRDARFEPILRGDLVDDPTTVWVTKLWICEMIKTHPKHQRLHLNGVPRRDGQVEIIPFLQDRGYLVKCVQFTTPPEVCDARTREGRFEDSDPTVRARRALVYEHETLPMMNSFARFGISKKQGTLIKIDNTKLSKEATASLIIDFAKLPFTVKQMFPQRSGSASDEIGMNAAIAAACA